MQPRMLRPLCLLRLTACLHFVIYGKRHRGLGVQWFTQDSPPLWFVSSVLHRESHHGSLVQLIHREPNPGSFQWFTQTTISLREIYIGQNHGSSVKWFSGSTIMVRHFYNSPGALLWFIMFDSQGAPSLFISSVISIGHQHNLLDQWFTGSTIIVQQLGNSQGVTS